MDNVEHDSIKEIQCNICSLPFQRSLSFEYLIEDVERISKDKNNLLSASATELLQKINKVPVLKKKITDYDILKQHEGLVQQLMVFVFNPMDCNTDIVAAFPPFEMEPIVSSSKFKDIISASHKKLEIASSSHEENELIPFIYQAYMMILDKVYDFKLPINMPFSFKVTDLNNQSVRYYNKNFNASHLRVKPIGKLKKLKPETIATLFDRDNDLDYWNELIPLDKFEFTGFMRFKYIDITREYVISELKSDLLDKNTIVSTEGYKRILEKVRSLMDNPLIRFGLASAKHVETEGKHESFLWKPIIPQDNIKHTDYEGSMYEKAYVEKRIILSSDLKEVEQNKITEKLLDNGICSHAIVPLLIEGKVVGMLEFGSALPGSLSMLQIKMLYDLFPVFAIALKRAQEEWDDKVRALIQEEFTAIHPTVEWRFRQEASAILNNVDSTLVREPIIFEDIVPIYGASDIRGSSVERNKAIQADLTEQLEKAYEILAKEREIRDIPLLNDMAFKIGQHLRTVKKGLKAGDEVSIVEFLKKEIDPFLILLKERDVALQEPVDAYFEMLDPELHVLYKKRKDFEESLTLINDKVSEIIDDEQEKAQDVFPHYFEKYRTDGIEYNGYLGQSLVKDLNYNDMYLKNIRLWQLLVKVKIARKVKDIQPDLKTKLDITQLILVHSNPLSIAFRQDEKKFDVAGAYNIRYEITKKRIDKAMVNGTNERLTQVGKIAIIYSHANEITEYKRYIEYMIAQGFLTNKVEELELEDLKGASGLKALRVEVDFKSLTSCQINQQVLENVSDE